ncbi:hypothetical protein A2625_01775 [candidate division WOR-1 bacterium RIFCSPHIGHO2_01_FULL_53_15]|uniref:Uncharacterized protein n=1 Tax=candidate division WOR-1 bacterium RIFCSPHIGHO2_01_FULL_53_15 TaxID=1802564 RepID=A0A1F4Q2E2_UNCSA|nr:MAG: hypothetical protein A2625_01775 [candidate division WOR-1 bacterium RIFCSPHIGHO2_01_FULL_53_15]
MSDNKSALEKLEELIKNMWRNSGSASVIAAKHTEFIVEPKIFLGDKLNPDILKLLVLNYLAQTSRQDSGVGNIEATPEKLVIKSPKGKPLVIVRDRNIIQQYLAAKTPY